MARKVSWKRDPRLQRILKQNSERRTWERAQQSKHKGAEKVIFGVCLVVVVLSIVAWTAIQIAWSLLLLAGSIALGVIIALR